MKISEAMRIGSKAGPQLFNRAMDMEGGSCAMGAIGRGLGYGPLDLWSPRLRLDEPFPKLMESAQCPVGNCTEHTNGSVRLYRAPSFLAEVIIHLNNDHRWSRERIADWVEDNFEGGRNIPAAEIHAFMGEPIESKALVLRGPTNPSKAEAGEVAHRYFGILHDSRR